MPDVATPTREVARILRRFLPSRAGCTFLEVGCAPGRFMAYFHREFGYYPAGVDYSSVGVRATHQNMASLHVDAEVFEGDFLTFNAGGRTFDIVFSAGFLEHFDPMPPVVDRFASMSRWFVVTLVPNVYGVNGFISKTIRPEVFKGHQRITPQSLHSLHEEAGLKTLFCNYVGGISLIYPASGRPLFGRHPLFSKALNAPVRLLNRVGQFLPSTRLLSGQLLYVGVRS
jgi:SAM-dependent methyltransferase